MRADANGLNLLSKEIPKNQKGIVQGNKLIFEVSYKTSGQTIDFAQTDSLTGPVTDTGIIYPRFDRKRTKLQINTDPPHYDVYIDEELIGKSPISWWVGINKSHVVQVKHDQYHTGIKVVVPEEMIQEEKLIIIQRLEPLPVSPGSTLQFSRSPGKNVLHQRVTVKTPAAYRPFKIKACSGSSTWRLYHHLAQHFHKNF